MDAVLKQYRYRAKPLVMVLVILFFAACAFGLSQGAQTNDRALIINHVIELDAAQAAIFYWVLAACSVAFVLIGIFGFIAAFAKPMFVEITDNAINIPNILRRKITSVPFADITEIRHQKVQQQEFLTLLYADKKASISRSNMPTKADFEDVATLIHSKVSGVA